MKNQFITGVFTVMATMCILFVFTLMAAYINDAIIESKPISYPEEIQTVKAGDTLYVTSVSDSIYIGFSGKKRINNE